MPIRPDLLLAHVFPEARQAYTKRDAILYALGVGLGAQSDRRRSISDSCSKTGLRALPTFAVTLGPLGMWIRAPQFGVDFARLVHYEQAATFPAPLPAEGEIVARARVRLRLTIAARARARVVVVEREIRDAVHSTSSIAT